MSKVLITKPIVVQLYGYPGSGKTNFASELAAATNLIHLYNEKISQEFFGRPYSDNKESTDKLIMMLAEEFIGAGLGIILDVDSSKIKNRKMVREFATKNKAGNLVVWFQLDPETAFARKSQIDRRKSENKYETSLSYSDFNDKTKTMQNPVNEECVVVSGKHTFRTQKAAILRRLYDLGITSQAQTQANLIKPGLVNLVPQTHLGGVRNISIR
ncbi:hypothetical protein A3F37_02260 [Candidatus Saccharibacteria bacterium RIFCSPHIGHO2_12_FULL_41_12]|nr:MAG: hypothetical protein A3F37_02260 [Candidatus Saccharibacteria bacterium RIFCSPHIGHO2_12_FULL_41_12]